MRLRSELLNQGLNEVDITDLEKDDSLNDSERMRDLIMGLYLRTRYSEKKLEEYSKEIDRLSFELTYSMFIGGLFGLSIGLGLCSLT